MKQNVWEVWVRVAIGLAIVAAVWVLYLGSRLPGKGPIAAYLFGPLIMSAVALLLGLWGMVVCLRKGPGLAGPDGKRKRPRTMGFALLAFVIGGSNVPFPFPTRFEGRFTSLPIEFPCEGRWRAVWAGLDAQTNLMGRVRPDVRFGMTFVRAETERLGEHSVLADGAWPEASGWGSVVEAPCSGRVVALDQGLGETPQALGCHLVLQVSEEQFLFLSHLQADSIQVQVGEEVQAGDQVARIGSSGHSPFVREPHLCLHLQDSPEAFWGQGIPFQLRDVLLDGEFEQRGLPKGGVDREGRLAGDWIERQESPGDSVETE